MIETQDINSMKLSIILEKNKNNYTKKEVSLYEYVALNLDKVMYHSLTELSEIANVGEATILRFCRKLGYKGYQDFKLAVAQELTLQPKYNGNETFVEKIMHNMMEVLENTYEVVDHDALEKSIKIIRSMQKIVIFGVGHSGITAHDLQSRFLRYGINVEVITDSHFQVMRACSMDESTCIIAISLSGSTKDIVDSVQIGRDKKATVIAITNYVKSPLTKLADTVLLTSGKENPLDGGSMVAKVSQLYVIDLLCTGLMMEDVERAKQLKGETAASVSNKLY